MWCENYSKRLTHTVGGFLYFTWYISIRYRRFFRDQSFGIQPKNAQTFEPVKRRGYDKLPMILVSDLKTNKGRKFIEFMKETFHLQLRTDPQSLHSIK